MSDVEFETPADSPADSPAGTPAAPPAGSPAAADAGPAPLPRPRAVAVTVLWAGAAALSLIAAYNDLYSVGYGAQGQADYTVDAWGHYTGPGAGAFPQTGARYALLLSLCALGFGLLTVGALGRLVVRLPGGPRLDLALTGGAFLAAGVLAGALVAIYLQTDSILQNVRDRVRFGVSIGDPIRGNVGTSIGAAPYVALAALACAVLAIAATHWNRTGPVPAEAAGTGSPPVAGAPVEPVDVPAAREPGARGDETLDV